MDINRGSYVDYHRRLFTGPRIHWSKSTESGEVHQLVMLHYTAFDERGGGMAKTSVWYVDTYGKSEPLRAFSEARQRTTSIGAPYV